MVLESNTENKMMLDNFSSPYTQKMSGIEKHICNIYLCKSIIQFVYLHEVYADIYTYTLITTYMLYPKYRICIISKQVGGRIKIWLKEKDVNIEPLN